MAETSPNTPLLDVSLLEQPLAAGEVGAHEAERVTAGLDRINDLVTRGVYAEAGALAESLLREGSRDVRLLSPFLFGVFLQHGPSAVHALFVYLYRALTDHWDVFGPEGRKEALADNSLRWLFKNLTKHLEYHERLQDEAWQAWCEPRNREPVQQALGLAEALVTATSSTLPKGACLPAFHQLVAWLEAFAKNFLAEPARPEDTPAADAAPASDGEAAPTGEGATREKTMEDAVDEAKETAAPEGAAPPPSKAARAGEPSVPISPALALLIRKLQAFDALVRSEDFLKAGVVATDVLGIVEQFDPRLYLPTLFTPFFARLSTQAHLLEPRMHAGKSLSFRALQQLYQMDLEAFLSQKAPHDEESEDFLDE